MVNFKIQQSIERKKKEMLNKHLVFLVGQTERYSSMLAKNLLQAQEEEIEGSRDKLAYDRELREDGAPTCSGEYSTENGIDSDFEHESLVQDSR